MFYCKHVFVFTTYTYRFFFVQHIFRVIHATCPQICHKSVVFPLFCPQKKNNFYLLLFLVCPLRMLWKYTVLSADDDLVNLIRIGSGLCDIVDTLRVNKYWVIRLIYYYKFGLEIPYISVNFIMDFFYNFEIYVFGSLRCFSWNFNQR